MSGLVPKISFSLQRRILKASSCPTGYYTLLGGGATSSFRGLSGALYAPSHQTTKYGPNLHDGQSKSRRYRSVASAFIREFQRAKIPFTAAGILEFKKKCARYSYNQILGDHGEKMYDLWISLKDIKEPNEGSADLDKTLSWQEDICSPAPWRSEFAADRYRSYKVYMIWEALYHHSSVFREVMKDKERCENLLERNCIESSILWWLLDDLYDGGYLDCEYVDRLPDPIIYTRIQNSQVATA